MIDSQRHCENYRKALISSDIKSFHYDIQLAPADSKVWRKNNSNKWTNYNSPFLPKVKNSSRG